LQDSPVSRYFHLGQRPSASYAEKPTVCSFLNLKEQVSYPYGYKSIRQ